MPRISLLTAGPNASGAEIPAARAGATVKLTPAQIAAAALTATAPASVGNANAAGTAAVAARLDHVHAHGSQTEPTHHAAATTSAAGFMSAADKTKLNGVETSADVTDATNVAAAGAVMDSDFSGSFGAELVRVSTGSYAAVKINRAATAAPTVNDDATQDYSVGSRWYDTTNDRSYTCLDATAGAAVWRETSVIAAAVDAAGAVMNSDYTPAHSILAQQAGTGSPTAVTVGVSTLLGRSAGGGSPIAALAAADARAILNYPSGEVSYDNSTSGLTATDVKAAIDELAAAPSGGLPTIDSYSLFSAGAAAGDRDYYEAASDLLNVPTFTMSALVRIYGNGGTQYICGSSTEFADGHFLAVLGEEVRVQAIDTAGGSFTANWFQPSEHGKWLLLSMTKATFGADWTTRIIVNGAGVGENYQAANGGARATNNFAIGAASGGGGNPCDRIRIAWVSLAFRQLQQDEQKEWWESIIENDGAYLSPSSGALDHAWVLSGTPGATLADQIGSADLTRTGSAASLALTTRKFTT